MGTGAQAGWGIDWSHLREEWKAQRELRVEVGQRKVRKTEGRDEAEDEKEEEEEKVD